MSSKIVTIERHIFEKQKRFPQATGELTALLYDLALAGKMIAAETRRAGLNSSIQGAAGTTNIYGEDQQKLDVYADSMIFKLNDHTNRLCAMASEEHEEHPTNPGALRQRQLRAAVRPAGRLIQHRCECVRWDDLRHPPQDHQRRNRTLADVLQPGKRLVAAGYMIYGSSTMMIYTTGDGVHGFTLDPSVGEFLLKP